MFRLRSGFRCGSGILPPRSRSRRDASPTSSCRSAQTKHISDRRSNRKNGVSGRDPALRGAVRSLRRTVSTPRSARACAPWLTARYAVFRCSGMESAADRRRRTRTREGYFCPGDLPGQKPRALRAAWVLLRGGSGSRRQADENRWLGWERNKAPQARSFMPVRSTGIKNLSACVRVGPRLIEGLFALVCVGPWLIENFSESVRGRATNVSP
jgi:hypothetical protein